MLVSQITKTERSGLMTKFGIKDSLVTETLKDTKQEYHEIYEMTAEEPALRIRKITNELYHSEPLDWIVEQYNPTMHEMYVATALHHSLKYFGIDHDDIYSWSRISDPNTRENDSRKYERNVFRSIELTGYSVKGFLASLLLEASTENLKGSDADENYSRLFKSFVRLMEFVFNDANRKRMHAEGLDPIDVVRLWARSDEIEFSWGEILGQKEWLDTNEVMDIDAWFGNES